jgi:hypothetical protein
VFGIVSRTAGDIDLLVLANREEVTRKVREKFPHVHENYIHIDYPIFDDVAVELHFLPSYANNPVYQLMHMMHHFFDEGIGLRQMIDYYYLLRKAKNDVECKREEVMKMLKYLNLYNFAGALMYIMRKVLGLDDEYLIVPVDERRGQTLLKEILKGGNFGHYSELDQNNAAKKYFQKT